MVAEMQHVGRTTCDEAVEGLLKADNTALQLSKAD